MTDLINKPIDLGVSQNALSIARMIDRLGEGRWDITIKKDSIKGICEISISEIQVFNRKNFEYLLERKMEKSSPEENKI